MTHSLLLKRRKKGTEELYSLKKPKSQNRTNICILLHLTATTLLEAEKIADRRADIFIFQGWSWQWTEELGCH